MYLNRTGKSQAFIIFGLLVLASVIVSYLMVTQGVLAGPLTVMAIGGLFLSVLILRDYVIGFYVLFTLGMFIFWIDRMIPNMPVPFGVVYDALSGFVFIALFIHGKEKRDWTAFNNPITIIFFIITAYQILELFNPAAVSRTAWLVSMRNNTSFLMYVVCFQMFSSTKSILKFTWVWIGMATFVALYGCYQEYVDLTPFEWRWMNAAPERLKLYMIWGRLRKFSILSDPSSFGCFMAFSSLACMVLAMGPFKTSLRIFLAILGVLMFVSMSYSGTRTAMAMYAVGIAFFIVMTLRNRRTIMGGIALLVIGTVLMVGPFYGGTINRIRSTFKPSDDPSMVVRDVKRVRLQQYILSHPMGGGLYTTGANGVRYSKGHELAGGWDPDSGYLLIALEMGWIGLLIFQVFFFIVMLKGIRCFFEVEDPLLKTLTLAYIVPFMALSVAHFTQDALFQKPVNLIIIATYAIVVRIPMLKKKLFSVDLV